MVAIEFNFASLGSRAWSAPGCSSGSCSRSVAVVLSIARTVSGSRTHRRIRLRKRHIPGFYVPREDSLLRRQLWHQRQQQQKQDAAGDRQDSLA